MNDNAAIFHEKVRVHSSSLFGKFLFVCLFLFNFAECICRHMEKSLESGTGPSQVTDRCGEPIGSPSASASLPSDGSRGRAGRLPKRGVRVGVNG